MQSTRTSKPDICILSLTVSNKQTNSVEQTSSWEVNSRPASKEIPSLDASQGFIICYTNIFYWSLFWASWIQSTSWLPNCLRFILILFSHLGLRLKKNPLSFYNEMKTQKVLLGEQLAQQSYRDRSRHFSLPQRSRQVLGPTQPNPLLTCI
jgi:hypothetical protein